MAVSLLMKAFPMIRSVRTRCLAAASLLAVPAPLLAQEAVGAAPEVAQVQDSSPGSRDAPLAAETDPDNTIVISARRGTVDTDIPPQLELGTEDIASYGVSSIEELLEALAPEVGSARGRGSGGRPVVLINGMRVTGFRELRDLPPEAIDRVQVFPEELALEYGFRPDQRVVNFILKSDFQQFAVELEGAVPTAGGFAEGEVDTTYTRIVGGGRLNIDVEYEPSSALTESERGIVQSDPDSLGGVDEGDYRTLIPESHAFELNGSWNGTLSPKTSLTLSGEYNHSESTALLGLQGATLTVPEDSPYARQAGDETITRLFEDAGALERERRSDSFELGGTLNGQFAGGYRWTLTANAGRNEQETFTEREADSSALVAAVAAGDPAVDPFAPGLGAGLTPTLDVNRSQTTTASTEANVAGAPFDLPAGPVRVSLTGGYDYTAIDGTSTRSGITSETDLSRSIFTARANADIPISSVRDDVLAGIGDLGLNANIGVREVSDFGSLFEYGYGLRWEPVEGLSLLASVIGEEAAPGISDLGAPVEVTPNSRVYDLATGQTVLVDRITGGNPDLLAEQRRDFKLSLNWSPGNDREKQITVEYVKNHSEDVTSGFPLLTPAIEAAFPDRVTRDANGQLVQLDARSITLSEVDSQRIRTSLSLRGELSKPDDDGEGGERGARRGGGSPMGMMGGSGGPPGGRWNLSLTHTWSLEESVLIRPGLDRLDLLDGDIIGSGTPNSRHSFELIGGIFKDGFGLRASGDYTGAARVTGSDLPGSADLRYGDLFTLDLRAFYTFDSAPQLTEDYPFLKGSRVSLDIENVFGGIRRIEDETGTVPLSFQPAYVDARGRVVELSFRKRF